LIYNSCSRSRKGEKETRNTDITITANTIRFLMGCLVLRHWCLNRKKR